MNDKKIKIIFALTLIIAFAIRVYSVRASLPHTYWHDENNYIETALRFGAGNFKLMSFSHGGLYQIALFLCYAVYYLLANITGSIHSASEFYVSYLKDPTAFFVIARVFTVLCGTGIVYLTYSIAKRIYDAKTALAAGIFSAFSFIMIQMSFFALADIPSVFILLLAVSAIVRSIEKPSDNKFYYIACALVGLAAACKYYTAFGVAVIYTAAFIKSASSEHKAERLSSLVVFGSLFVAAGFLIGMPFLVTDLAGFYKDTFVRMGGEYILQNPNKNTWLFYFTNHMPNGLGVPLEVTALAGIVYAFYKHSKWDLLMAAFPIAYYMVLMYSVGFAYHMLPAIPFILILGARALTSLADRFFPKHSLSACLCLALLAVAPTLCDSLKYIAVISSPDTRDEAKKWIDENIPAGSAILSEGYIQTLPIHTAPLTDDMKTLKRDREYIISRGGNGSSIGIKISNFGKIYGRDKAYDIFKVDRMTITDLGAYPAEYVMMIGSNDNAEGVELLYYLESDYFQKRKALRDHVTDKYKLTATFRPAKEFTLMFPHMMDYDYRMIRQAPLLKFKDYKRGPRIDIFRKAD